MDETDYNAPLDRNAQERDEAKVSALGVKLDASQALTTQLNADISADAWGYPQFDDIEDEQQRATVSDQIRSAGHGVAENLIEARLHEVEVRRIVGPNGVPMASNSASLNDHLRNDHLELHVVGFFRAFGSTLDCLAAVLIGALRVPQSLRLADMARLSRFESTSAGRDVPDDMPSEQREAWEQLVQTLAAEREQASGGWYVWGLEMRNALLHRGRGVKGFMPRPMSGRLAVVSSQNPASLRRYDYYLRKRPWLPDIVQMARAQSPSEVWLHEPVQETLAGLFEHLNLMVERLAAWVHRRWREQREQRTLVSPVRAWRLTPRPDTSFAGFGEVAGEPHFDAIVVNPATTEHFRLAEELRLHLLREAEDGNGERDD